MLTQIHFLLTYTCLYECDHCFLYCGPEAEGTFTLQQLRLVFEEIAKIGTIDTVYFEGGESFLYYPLLLEGLRIAREQGLEAGVVTNAYWATSIEDAELWLKPLKELGLADLSISDDVFHSSAEENPAKVALKAAEKLGLPVSTICIEEPVVEHAAEDDREMGASIVGGGVVFRGRAIEKLADGLPMRKWDTLTRCPYEDLEHPGRVHVDPFGNVHYCQGLSIGNMWETPLSELLAEYDAAAHPICGPLLRGGPAQLAREQGIKVEDGYIDECHLCFTARSALLERYPQYLAPRPVYGVK
ncbi:radical SAM protein [Candidatus Neomarinimicrobiota bacterium]